MSADEAAHFVNSLLVRDYLLGAIGRNPLSFALDYYAHVPRVSIGHWPPFYYLVQGLLVSSWDRSVRAAIEFQSVIAGMLGATVGTIVTLRHGLLTGIAAMAAVLLSPTLLFLVDTVAIDNFLALLMLIAALCWARFATSLSLSWSVLFAFAASAAILTKGNAFSLGLLPIFYIALTGRIGLLASPRIWLAAAIVVVLAVPWHAFTYRLVARGFVYHWGFDFTSLAATTYPGMALSVFGLIGIASFLFGAVVIIQRNFRGEIDAVGTSLLALVLASICFQFIVPADIERRYLVPMVPAVVIVAVEGIVAASERWLPRSITRVRLAVGAIVSAVLVIVIATTFQPPHVTTEDMDAIAREIIVASDSSSSQANPLVLIATDDHAEGALIAEFAARDPHHMFYAIRASSALAASNFNGTRYEARFASDAEVERWIRDSRIGWLVLDTSPASLAMRHNRQVLNVVAMHEKDWPSHAHYRLGDGDVTLYRVDSEVPSPAEVAQVVRQILPKQIAGE